MDEGINKIENGSGEKKSAFEDAMERARQVAAKLSQHTGTKRASDDGGNSPVAKKVALPESTEGMTAGQIAAMKAAEVARQINEQLGIASKRPNEVATVATLLLTEYLRVPDSLVGLGGEKIARIQTDSACKIQISQDLIPSEQGDEVERQCTLTGSREAIDRAKLIINEVLEGGLKRRSLKFDGSRQDSLYGEYGNKRADLVEVTQNVPADRAGYVIGKGGETIKDINRRSGAYVETDRSQKAGEPGQWRIFKIRGTKEQVAMAQELIDEKCRPPARPAAHLRSPGYGGGYDRRDDWSYRYKHNGPVNNIPTWQQVPSEALYQTPAMDWATQWQSYMMASAGLAGMQSALPFVAQQYAVQAQVGPTTDGVAQVNEQSESPSVVTAAAAATTDNALTTAADGSSSSAEVQDYSIQWAHYYRSMGMHEQADAILQQAAKTFSKVNATAEGQSATADTARETNSEANALEEDKDTEQD